MITFGAGVVYDVVEKNVDSSFDTTKLVAQDDRRVGPFDRAHTSFYSILPYLERLHRLGI